MSVAVARLHSGDILDTNTLDCFGNVLKKPGDKLSMVKGDNPLAGPFYVEGAEPGTVVEVFQRGYRIGDSVVRPARVVVAG